MNTVIIILLILLLITVTAVGMIASRNRTAHSATDAMREYIKGLEESNRRNIEMLQQRHSAEIKMITERNEQHAEMMSKQWETRLEQLDRQSQLAFRNLSRLALDGSVERLKDVNGEMLDSVLSPLRQRLETLSRLIHQTEVNSATSQQSLKDRIEMLAELNRTMSEDARALTSALKGNSKVQGDWGETILRTLLEKAGLEEGVNFRFQPGSENGVAYRDENRALLRPDFIVDIPGGRHVIVDSKVSLTDYVKYCDATDREQRTAAARRHVASVKKHIDELHSKKYERVVPGAMEHVLMFIPNEGAYLAAMSIDSELWRYAYDRKVVMVTAPHLLTAIQVIGQMWRQERQDRNAAEIARVAGLLYDSFVDFNVRMERIGSAIDSTRKIYDETRNMLNEGNTQSLTRRAARLRELGAKTHKTLPSDINE